MKLDDLKAFVAKAFENATEKEQIENAVKINSMIDEVAKEQEQLLDKNKELLNSYKEVVLHTSVAPNPNISTEATGGTALTFEDALNAFVEKQANGGK